MSDEPQDLLLRRNSLELGPETDVDITDLGPETEHRLSFDSDDGGVALPSLNRNQALAEYKMKHESEKNAKENRSLKARLVRRGYLIDTIRKAYLRDVVVVAEELSQRAYKGKEYKPSHAVTTLPSVDLKHCLHLFSPVETAFNMKPCESCGGTMELIHMETAKVAELQSQVDLLQKSESEVKAERNNIQALLYREREALENEKQLREEEQGYFLKEIAKLKQRLIDDDAPGLRTKLMGLNRLKKELQEAQEKAEDFDKIERRLAESKVHVSSLQEQIKDFQEEVRSLNDNVAQLEETNQQLESDKKDTEDALEEVKEKIASMKKDYKQARKDVKKAEKDVARKQQALEKAKTAELDMKAKMMNVGGDWKEKVEDLEKENEEMQTKVDDMRESEAKMKREMKKLEKEMEKKEAAFKKEKDKLLRDMKEEEQRLRKEIDRVKRTAKKAAASRGAVGASATAAVMESAADDAGGDDEEMDFDFGIEEDTGGDMAAAPPSGDLDDFVDDADAGAGGSGADATRDSGSSSAGADGGGASSKAASAGSGSSGGAQQATVAAASSGGGGGGGRHETRRPTVAEQIELEELDLSAHSLTEEAVALIGLGMTPLSAGADIRADEYNKMQALAKELDQKCKDMVSRLQTMHKKCQSLVAQVEDKASKCAAFEKEADAERTLRKALEDSISELEMKVQMMEDEKFAMMKRVQGADNAEGDLANELSAAVKEQRRLERDAQNSNRELKLIRKLRAGLQLCVVRLATVMDEFNSEKRINSGMVQDRLNELKESEKDGVNNIKLFNRFVEKTEEEFNKKLTDFTQLVSESDEKTKAANSQAVLAQKALANLEAQLQKANADIGVLNEEKEELEGQAKLRAKAYKEMESGLGRKIANLDEMLTAKEHEYVELQARMKKIQDTLTKTTAEKQGLQRKLSDALNRAEVLVGESKEQALEIETLTRKLAEVEEALAVERQKCEALTTRGAEQEAELKQIRDTEAARIAGRKEKEVQVEIEPETQDFCAQTSFSAPPATLRQHNSVTCHPAYVEERARRPVVIARPQVFPLPRALGDVKAPLKYMMPLGLNASSSHPLLGQNRNHLFRPQTAPSVDPLLAASRSTSSFGRPTTAPKQWASKGVQY